MDLRVLGRRNVAGFVGMHRSRELANYSAVVYVGSTYDEPIPVAFLDDVTATTTTSGLVPGPGWHSLELHFLTNDSASVSEVWLDGTKVTDLSSAVTNLGTAPITEFQIGEVQTGRTYDVVFDDAAFGTQPLGP